MISLVFTNLEPSELAREAVLERLGPTCEKFPALKEARIVVTLGMEDSSQPEGPDLFRVKTRISGGHYHGLVLDKAATSLYAALAAVSESLLEKLKPDRARSRVKLPETKGGSSSRADAGGPFF